MHKVPFNIFDTVYDDGHAQKIYTLQANSPIDLFGKANLDLPSTTPGEVEIEKVTLKVFMPKRSHAEALSVLQDIAGQLRIIAPDGVIPLHVEPHLSESVQPVWAVATPVDPGVKMKASDFRVTVAVSEESRALLIGAEGWVRVYVDGALVNEAKFAERTGASGGTEGRPASGFEEAPSSEGVTVIHTPVPTEKAFEAAQAIAKAVAPSSDAPADFEEAKDAMKLGKGLVSTIAKAPGEIEADVHLPPQEWGKLPGVAPSAPDPSLYGPDFDFNALLKPPYVQDGANSVVRAKRELELAGLIGPGSDYDGMLARAALDLLRLFSAQGHSGFSAHATVRLFSQLARFENLSPLTNDPAEWVEVGTEPDGRTLYQSARNSEAFSYDGGETYYVLSELHARLECEKCGIAFESAARPGQPEDKPARSWNHEAHRIYTVPECNELRISPEERCDGPGEVDSGKVYERGSQAGQKRYICNGNMILRKAGKRKEDAMHKARDRKRTIA